MRFSVIASASLALMGLFATPAFAQEATTTTTVDAPQTQAQSKSDRPESGFELGARLGFALPLGNGVQDGKMSDALNGAVPVIVDLGYRINPHFYIGAYGQAGYGLPANDSCGKSGVSCSAQSYRLGVNAHYHFTPEASFDPWIGVGTGYEWLHQSAEGGGLTASSTFSGFEIVNVQVGGDYHLSPNASIGPFASFALSQYSNQSAALNGQDAQIPSSIEHTALHEWLTIGIKGTFDL